MPAVLTPTRLGLLARLRYAIRAAYIRMQIASAELDVDHWLADIEHAKSLPVKIAAHRHHIALLRVKLIDAEVGR